MATDLQTLLRRFPYWSGGHLLLGEDALVRDDIGTAYASSQAALVLASSSLSPNSTTTHANFILARCYLRRGNPDRAAQYLSKIHTTSLPATGPVSRHAVDEELAAAWMAKGDLQKALDILKAIPPEFLSPAAKAAKGFIERKGDV